MKNKFALHLLDNKDPRDTWHGYAIMPSDGTEGFLVGDIDSVRVLSKRLNRFLENGKHDGGISSNDERLGWKWLDIAEAMNLAHTYGLPVAAPTIRLACSRRKIIDAKLDGKTWRFPRSTFLGWLMQSSHKRGRQKRQ